MYDNIWFSNNLFTELSFSRTPLEKRGFFLRFLLHQDFKSHRKNWKKIIPISFFIGLSPSFDGFLRSRLTTLNDLSSRAGPILKSRYMSRGLVILFSQCNFSSLIVISPLIFGLLCKGFSISAQICSCLGSFLTYNRVK